MCLSVSLFVCPLACLKSTYVQISRNFLHLLTVAVARSSSDDDAVRHVFPVLRMTSRFHTKDGANEPQSYMFRLSLRYGQASQHSMKMDGILFFSVRTLKSCVGITSCTKIRMSFSRRSVEFVFVFLVVATGSREDARVPSVFHFL